MSIENSLKPFAFVLMPFDPEFDRIYERLIKPSIEEEGYEVRRADSDLNQRNIMRTIIEGIGLADLVVAELTGNNTNVFYELGIAHGLQKPVIMISQDLSQVPFDLRSYNVVTYTTEFDAVDNFKDALRGLALGNRDGSVNFENPVSDFAPADMVPAIPSSRNAATAELANDPTAERETEEVTTEERGVLDFAVGAEAAMQQIATTSETLTEFVNDFAASMAARGAEAEVVSQSANAGSAARMLRLARSMAKDMTTFSDNVDAQLPDFRRAWQSFENDFTNMLSSVFIESEEDHEAAVQLISQLEGLRDGISQALEGSDEARSMFAPLKGASKHLNAAIRRIEKTLAAVYAEFSTGESIAIRTINLLDQKIQSS